MCTEFWWKNLSVRPGLRWKCDIKTRVEVIGLENVNLVDLAQEKSGW